jgi:hypothetical protein
VDEAAAGQKYMLVWSSALGSEHSSMLPVLLPMPEGPGRHDAAVKAMQVGQLLHFPFNNNNDIILMLFIKYDIYDNGSDAGGPAAAAA